MKQRQEGNPSLSTSLPAKLKPARAQQWPRVVAPPSKISHVMWNLNRERARRHAVSLVQQVCDTRRHAKGKGKGSGEAWRQGCDVQQQMKGHSCQALRGGS